MQEKRIASPTRLALFRLMNRRRRSYACPVCGYEGPFRDFDGAAGLRRDAQCPACNALERHRLQSLVLRQVLGGMATGSQRMLHVAPEAFFRQALASQFERYETADLAMNGVDHHVDLQRLPFGDESYDVVFASHVLEHIPDDRAAIAEIRRILRPGGIAILPVPIVAPRTVEYGAPNPNEDGHVRAPGPDYFDRLRACFARVETHASQDWPERHQLFIYEDRSHWPTAKCPQRPPMAGDRHVDVVPVCYA